MAASDMADWKELANNPYGWVGIWGPYGGKAGDPVPVSITGASITIDSVTIDKVKIDQSTPGTTNGVVVNSGSVSISGTPTLDIKAGTSISLGTATPPVNLVSASGVTIPVTVTSASTISVTNTLTTPLTTVGNTLGIISVVGDDTAYSAGQTIGGLITLTSALRTSSLQATLQSLSLSNVDGQHPDLTVLITSTSPGATADHATISVTGMLANSNVKGVVVISVEAADWVDVVSGSVTASFVDLTSKCGQVLTGSGTNAHLYMIIIAGGAVTFATDQLYVRSAFYRD